VAQHQIDPEARPYDPAKLPRKRDVDGPTFFSVDMRAGVVVGNKALLYVKGGYANGRINATYTAGGTTTKDGTNSDGWRVGTGVELPVAKNMLVRAEYRYTNYSDTDLARHRSWLD